MAPALDALDEVAALDHVGPGPAGRVDPADSEAGATRDVASRRCSEPAAEPTRLIDQPEPDQAVFDAEFVALVLTEYPPTRGEGAPAQVPPRSATRTHRGEPVGGSPPYRDGRPRPSGTSNPRGDRRRPGPWPRSPPGPLSQTPLSSPAKEVSGSQEASLCKV